MIFFENTISDIESFISMLTKEKDCLTLSLLLEHISEYKKEYKNLYETLSQRIHEIIKDNFEIIEYLPQNSTCETIELEYYSPYAKANDKNEQNFDFDWCYENQCYEVYFDYEILKDYADNTNIEFEILSVFLPYENGYIDVTNNVNQMSLIDKLSELERYSVFELQNPQYNDFD